MTTVPNPFTALLQMLAKAFAPLANRDGLGSRRAFVIEVARSKPRRSPRASTSPAQEAATPDSLNQHPVADPRRASIRACESDLPTLAARKE